MSKFSDKVYRNLYLVIPVLQFLLLELFVQPLAILPIPFLINIVFYVCLFLILLFIINKKGITIILTSTFWCCVGLINVALQQFRQTPVVPWDILSIKTGLTVASQYSLKFTSRVMMTLIGFIVLILIGCFTIRDKVTDKPKKRIIKSVISLILAVIMTFTIQIDNLDKYIKINPDLFDLEFHYSQNGFMFSFMRLLGNVNLDKPDKYDEDEVNDLLTDNETNIDTSQKPNIIVIMNEAYSDLSVLNSHLQTNEEVFPFINSLTENTVKGKAISSIKGGNTANSEYEFLTALPTAFLPKGTIPYQQYINNNINSLSRYLSNYNYETYAFHPWTLNSWNRNKIYEYLGFDNQIFSEDIVKNPIENTKLIRNIISDETTFDYIIRDYENRNVDKNFFEFCVTLQNHGSYEEISLSSITETNINNEMLNTYLSLMNETDKAFEKLVTYFKNIEEPTVILMFGDHQPADDITDLVKSSSSTTLDEYTVPYVLWANYDIGNNIKGETMSINYLSLLLLEVAEIPYNSFYNCVNSIYNEYPVISVSGIVDKNDNYYTNSKNCGDEIKLYEKISYHILSS